MGMLEGIVTRTSKNGKVGSTLYIGGEPMSEYNKGADIKCKGYECFSQYVPFVVDANPGDEIELVWDKGFQGKAYVKDVLVKHKK